MPDALASMGSIAVPVQGESPVPVRRKARFVQGVGDHHVTAEPVRKELGRTEERSNFLPHSFFEPGVAEGGEPWLLEPDGLVVGDFEVVSEIAPWLGACFEIGQESRARFHVLFDDTEIFPGLEQVTKKMRVTVIVSDSDHLGHVPLVCDGRNHAGMKELGDRGHHQDHGSAQYSPMLRGTP